MSYNDDEDLELRRLRKEAARKKAELEELQREELRRIREMEARKNGRGKKEYDPNLDSAFYVEDAPEPAPAAHSYKAAQNLAYGESGREDAAYEEDDYEDMDDEYEDEDSEYEDDDDDEYEDIYLAKSSSKKTKGKESPESKRTYRESQSPKTKQTYRESQSSSAKKSNAAKKKKKKKSPAKKFFTRLIAVLLILFILFSLAIGNITRKFNHIDTDVSHRAGTMKHSVVNVLLIGQDARDGQSGQRSDSMILLSINTIKNTVSMTSIMRDTYVDIPGYGGNRINAAYAFGGVDLLDATIEQNFDVTIDGNAMVDFDGFLEGMTAVGNLEMTLTAEEAAYMNANPGFGSNNDVSDEVWNLTEGVNTLTPSQLLAYSRIRYVGNSDWDRTERQRKVISAALSKVKHGHLISGYNMADKAAPSITTDLKTWGMLRLAFGIITGGEMKSHLIPVDGTYRNEMVNGMDVLVPDIDANREYLKKYMNGEE